MSLGPAAASGILYESRLHSADNLFKFNKTDGAKVKNIYIYINAVPEIHTYYNGECTE